MSRSRFTGSNSIVSLASLSSSAAGVHRSTLESIADKTEGPSSIRTGCAKISVSATGRNVPLADSFRSIIDALESAYLGLLTDEEGPGIGSETTSAGHMVVHVSSKKFLLRLVSQIHVLVSYVRITPERHSRLYRLFRTPCILQFS